jgi:hypothetical protein
MQERLARLEGRCDEIEKALAALTARLGAPSAAAPVAEPPPAAPPGVPARPMPQPDAAPLVGTLTDLGRCLLVLGGAFLIRAVTDSGAVPRGAGIALGLAYAIGWIAVADRIGGRGAPRSAALFGATAMLIASPLAVEAATRFVALPPWGSAAVIVAFTALALLVAVHRNLAALAWVASLSAIAALVALFSVASAAASAALGLLAIGVLTNLLADSRRSWSGPRWPAAAAADLFAAVAAWLMARPGGLPEVYAGLSAGVAVSIALALPALYVGSAALRTLRSFREVTGFDTVQSAASLGVGLGAASAVAGAATSGGFAVGAAGLLLAAACFAVASRLAARPGTFRFYAYLGLGLALYSGWLFFGDGPLAAFWAVLGLAAALVSTRRDSRTLRIHAAVYVAAAAFASGLFAAAVAAFLGAPPAPAVSPWVAAVLGASAAVWLALPATASPILRLIAAAIALSGLGTLAVFLVAHLTVGMEPGWLAAARTGVLAVSAILLAALWRARELPELKWLAYAVLATGAVKVVLQDVPQGGAASLVAALVLYGLALIVAPRWLRTR